MRNAIPEAAWQNKRAPQWLVLFLVLVASLPYLGAGFVWDDGPLIVDDLALLDGIGITQLWFEPVTGEGPGSNYYRPFGLTVLAVFGRFGPQSLHGVSVALHLINVVLIMRLSRNLRWPELGGLVYGLHPLVSEALGWSSSLPDILAITMALLAVSWPSKRIVWPMLLVALAGFSKETGLLIPLFVGSAGLIHRRWILSWALGCGLVVFARLYVGVSMSTDWFANIGMLPDALGWSLASIVWPFPLNAVRSLWVAPEWVLPASGIGLVMAAWWAQRDRVALCGLGLAMASPILALPVVLDGYLVAERYMTAGLVGVGIYAAARVPKTRAAMWVVVPLTIGCVMAHWMRAPAWKSDLALFGASVEATPNSSYSWHLYGVSLAQNGQFREAADAFGEGLRCRHPHTLDGLLRIRALVEAGESAEALEFAETGPQDDLTAEYIAWWGRAAYEAGQTERSKSLIIMLQTEEGFEGPPWVSSFADQLLVESPN